MRGVSEQVLVRDWKHGVEAIHHVPFVSMLKRLYDGGVRRQTLTR